MNFVVLVKLVETILKHVKSKMAQRIKFPSLIFVCHLTFKFETFCDGSTLFYLSFTGLATKTINASLTILEQRACWTIELQSNKKSFRFLKKRTYLLNLDFVLLFARNLQCQCNPKYFV